MKNREEKKKDVASLHKALGDMPHVFVASFAKLTVAQDFALRKAIRDVGGRYKVVKNTLAETAAKGTPSEPVLRGLTGMTSLAYTDADPVELAKALTAYAKANASFTFKAGLVEGKVFDISQIEALTKMPSKEELFSKLLYLLQAPAANLARTLNGVGGNTVRTLGGVGRNLTVVIDQACREKKFSS